MNNHRDLRLDLTILGSLTYAACFNASSGETANFSGSFFHSGHQDGFHGADLIFDFGISKMLPNQFSILRLRRRCVWLLRWCICGIIHAPIFAGFAAHSACARSNWSSTFSAVITRVPSSVVKINCGSVGPRKECFPSMIEFAEQAIIVAADMASWGTMAQTSSVNLVLKYVTKASAASIEPPGLCNMRSSEVSTSGHETFIRLDCAGQLFSERSVFKSVTDAMRHE